MSEADTPAIDHDALLEAYVNHLEGSDKSDSTVNRYVRNIRQYLAWVEQICSDNPQIDGPFDLNPETFTGHLMSMASDDYAPQSVKVRRAAVKLFYDVCQTLVNDQTVTALAGVDEQDVAVNPVEEADTSNIDLNSSKRADAVGEIPAFIEPEEKSNSLSTSLDLRRAISCSSDSCGRQAFGHTRLRE